MVNIWLMMVKNNLAGGIPTPLKNDGVRQWVSDDILFYEMENNIHVPKHQPGYDRFTGCSNGKPDHCNLPRQWKEA